MLVGISETVRVFSCCLCSIPPPSLSLRVRQRDRGRGGRNKLKVMTMLIALLLKVRQWIAGEIAGDGCSHISKLGYGELS